MSSQGQAELSPLQRALFELKQLRARLDAVEQARKEPIAIIGLGCRFPGGAESPETFWSLLRAGFDASREIPSDRWDIDGFFSPDFQAPGKMYTRRGAFLDRVDLFDPFFFGISPREAATIDPQQRLLLEVIWEALEHAGQRPDRLQGSATGLFIGAMNSDYQQLQRSTGDPAAIDSYTVTGSLFSVLGGRMSYVFGLQGPNASVDTACSSSLVTVHLACQSLRNHECDLALAGGVNMILAPEPMIERAKARMLAVDGRCKTFDAAADGYAVGEGCGMLVLKRLKDAQKNGDRILALIRGSAVNHDGPSSGLTVPNGPAQQALLQRAVAVAGVDPQAISYIEAHGTGTSLGDPIEINALAAVLCPERQRAQPLLIGSVKTNIGHLESAAGVAGIIKVVLALQHQELPPHLHLKEPNPLVPWNQLPVAVPTTLTPWPRSAKPRLAGVSSFGVSGTNAHVILEEAPASEAVLPTPEPAPELLVLSAKTGTALAALIDRYAEDLARPEAPPLAAVATTAALGRTPFAHRLALCGTSSAEVAQQLAAFKRGEARAVVSGQIGRKAPKIAFLFSGQGSQEAGMARVLYDREPVFRATFDRAAGLLQSELDHSLSSIFWPDPQASGPLLLAQTAYTQPALFVLQAALLALWRSWGIGPDAVFGHSVGELAAAHAAGVLSLADGVRLAAARGRLMQSLPVGGRMVAVLAPEDVVRPVLAPWQSEVAIAAINAPRETVISGPAAAVTAALQALLAQGVKGTSELAVSHAFHSPLVEPILPALADRAMTCALGAPQVPWVSGLTGKLATAAEVATGEYWVRQARQAVRCADAMATLAQEGCTLFVEVGPSTQLISLGKRCLPGPDAVWLPSLRASKDDQRQLRETLGALWVRGAEVDWPTYFGELQRARVSLPTYPFERQHYWFQTLPQAARTPVSAETTPPVAQPALHPLLGARFETPLEARIFTQHLSLAELPFLGDHRVLGKVLFPATATVEAALAAAEHGLGMHAPVAEAVEFERPLVLPPSGGLAVQLVVEPEASGAASFELYAESFDPTGGATFTRCARGRLRARPSHPEDSVPVLSALLERIHSAVAVDEFYLRLRQLGLEYGDSFRGLQQIWRAPGGSAPGGRAPGGRAPSEAIARLRDLPPLAGSHRPHPALVDACLQLTLAASDPDEEPRVALPVQLECVDLTPGPEAASPQWVHAVLRHTSATALSADLTLFAASGAVVGRVTGLHVRRLEAPALERLLGAAQRSWFYQLTWTAADRGPARQPNVGPGHASPGTWVLWHDGADRALWASELGAQLAAAGETWVSVVSRDELTAALQDVAGARPPLAGVVDLRGLALGAAPDLATQEPLIRDLLVAVHQLTELRPVRRPKLWLTTCGAQAASADAVTAPAQATLWGCARVLARELPQLWGGIVDFDPQTQVAVQVAAFAAELLHSDGEDQLAFRDGQRHVARLVRHPSSASAVLPAQLAAQATYLVTGGLGALGLQVARFLAARGARHLALLGRSAPSAEARAALAELRAQGVDVAILAADVASHDSLAAALSELASTRPPLRGIVHAAGVLADGIFLQQDWARFAQVLGPKVAGAWNLHQLTADCKLDFFVLFSSMSALLGTAGQANYAAANCFLDAFAHFRRAAGLPACALEWGPWGEVGMAAQQSQKRWAEQGLTPLDREAALAVLDFALAEPPSTLGILDVDWEQYVRHLRSERVPPLLTRLVTATATPSAPSAASDRERWLHMPREEVRTELIPLVLARVEALLGYPPGSGRLEPDQHLIKDVGMDSLMALELQGELQEIIGQQLSQQMLFEHPTVAAVVDYLLLELGSSAPAVAS